MTDKAEAYAARHSTRPPDASQTPGAGHRAATAEGMMIATGIFLIGFAYLAGVMTPAGLVVAASVALILSAVMMIVASWTAERNDRRATLIVRILDRHEIDRLYEYSEIKRGVEGCNVVMDQIGRTLQLLGDAQERTICKGARETEAVRQSVDSLGELLAAELLAINGAMNGLRSVIEAGNPRAATTPPAPLTDDPIAEMVRHKLESGDLWQTPPSEAHVDVDPAVDYGDRP
jgi:hypothetical protein